LRIYSRYPVAVASHNDKKKIRKSRHHKPSKLVTYKVKAGDTLWNISRKYNVSLSEIMKWNKLKYNAKLKPGMKLKIYKS
jgi:membrane-bound lytic murein transglycosylase D